MAKAPSSAIGIDLGRSTMKSVLLQRRGGNRFVLSHYAVREAGVDSGSTDDLAANIRGLLADMGGRAKHYALALTTQDSIIRIIDQPETPVHLLRDALRLNGIALLNQDCKDYVLDCDLLAPTDEPVPADGPVKQRKYLVGGLPRASVARVDEAFQKNKTPISAIQVGPISGFNAFEFAHREIFESEAFLLADLGHSVSTVTLGVQRELILVRSIDYGGNALIDMLINHGGSTEDDPMHLLEIGDEQAVEIARLSLNALTREISSSVGFLEGQREETVRRVFVSGGPARSPAVLRLLTEELGMPCEAWNPFQKCEITLPAPRKVALEIDRVNLNVACGAAAELLKGV